MSFALRNDTSKYKPEEGIEPTNLICTKDLLCQLSYSGESWRRDLNPQPIEYKSIALPIELLQLQETLR